MRNIRLYLWGFWILFLCLGCSSALENNAEEWLVTSTQKPVLPPKQHVINKTSVPHSCVYQPDFSYCLQNLPCPNSIWTNLDNWLCYPLAAGFYTYNAQKVDFRIVSDVEFDRAEYALKSHAISKIDKSEALNYCHVEEWNGAYENYYLVRSLVLDNWASMDSLFVYSKADYLIVTMSVMGRGPRQISRRAVVVNLPMEPQYVYVDVSIVE